VPYPIIAMACYGDADGLRILIEAGADVNKTGGKWHSALQASFCDDSDSKSPRLLLLATAPSDISLLLQHGRGFNPSTNTYTQPTSKNSRFYSQPAQTSTPVAALTALPLPVPTDPATTQQYRSSTDTAPPIPSTAGNGAHRSDLPSQEPATRSSTKSFSDTKQTSTSPVENGDRLYTSPLCSDLTTRKR